MSNKKKKRQTYIIEILKDLDKFSKISGLKPNKSKCEIARLGALKGVRVAVLWYAINKLLKFWEFIFLTIKSLKKKTLIII